MIRTCDGTDENLKREQVDRVAASGQESMHWIACDCGLTFDDVERLVIYPHHFIPSREDKAKLLALVDQMVKDNKSSEEIRQALQLTPHSVGATVGASQQPTTEGSSTMGDGENFEPATENVSAEGTANDSAADQDATDDALATEREGVEQDADAAERKSRY